MSVDLKNAILFMRNGNESWPAYDARFHRACNASPNIKYVQEDKTTFLDTPEMTGVTANINDQVTLIDNNGDMDQLSGGEL